jgi:integrase
MRDSGSGCWQEPPQPRADGSLRRALRSPAHRSSDDEIVGEWLAGGKHNGTVPALRATFNDAASAKAGWLVRHNPFALLGISKGPGRRHEQPPSEEQVWKLIRRAREMASPSFAAWLQVAAFTGLRPGELDALRRANVDLDRSRILVVEQFSAKTRTFTLPKNGLTREAPLTDPAREAITALPVESEFCFASIRGEHWTASARAYHWKAVKGSAGWGGSLYLATRHFAGWYMVNVLDVPSEDVAIALGHTDGGELVRRLYGHRDHERALDRVTAATGGRGASLRLACGRPDETGEPIRSRNLASAALHNYIAVFLDFWQQGC